MALHGEVLLANSHQTSVPLVPNGCLQVIRHPLKVHRATIELPVRAVIPNQVNVEVSLIIMRIGFMDRRGIHELLTFHVSAELLENPLALLGVELMRKLENPAEVRAACTLLMKGDAVELEALSVGRSLVPSRLRKEGDPTGLNVLAQLTCRALDLDPARLLGAIRLMIGDGLLYGGLP